MIWEIYLNDLHLKLDIRMQEHVTLIEGLMRRCQKILKH